MGAIRLSDPPERNEAIPAWEWPRRPVTQPLMAPTQVQLAAPAHVGDGAGLAASAADPGQAGDARLHKMPPHQIRDVAAELRGVPHRMRTRPVPANSRENAEGAEWAEGGRNAGSDQSAGAQPNSTSPPSSPLQPSAFLRNASRERSENAEGAERAEGGRSAGSLSRRAAQFHLRALLASPALRVPAKSFEIAERERGAGGGREDGWGRLAGSQPNHLPGPPHSCGKPRDREHGGR
jgi:hypothetical protein